MTTTLTVGSPTSVAPVIPPQTDRVYRKIDALTAEAVAACPKVLATRPDTLARLQAVRNFVVSAGGTAEEFDGWLQAVRRQLQLPTSRPFFAK